MEDSQRLSQVSTCTHIHVYMHSYIHSHTPLQMTTQTHMYMYQRQMGKRENNHHEINKMTVITSHLSTTLNVNGCKFIIKKPHVITH